MTTTAQRADYYKVSNPIFVRIYERVMPQGLAKGQARHLDELVAGLIGRVLEIGVGAGPTFARYPGEVSEVVGVEPEPRMRALAEVEAARASTPIQLVDAVADHLPFDDESFDAGVLAGILCTVPRPERALAELHRVIRPAASCATTSTSARTARPCAKPSGRSTTPLAPDQRRLPYQPRQRSQHSRRRIRDRAQPTLPVPPMRAGLARHPPRDRRRSTSMTDSAPRPTPMR